MATKQKLRLKNPYVNILKFLGTVLVIILGLFLFYRSNINDLKKLGYSEKASKVILTSMKKKDVLSIGKNKTLNAAFESDDYKEKNFSNYTKIKYVKQDNLIKNINKLIKVGYSNEQIYIILTHGDSKAVSEFAKRDKVRYLEEFFSVSYAKLENYDRYVKYMSNSREDEETSAFLVNLDMDKEEYEDPTLVTEFSYTMLVNKHRNLSEDFVPDNLATIPDTYTKGVKLKANKVATNHLIQMIKDAEKEDLHLFINSAYRSYQDQQEVTEEYTKLYGEEYVKNYVLRPGFSEHQTALGFDIGSLNSSVFAQSKEYSWVVDNCYKYGFIYRFKPDYEDITGIKSESWHYRYVGEKAAKYIYENDMTLEEYYAKFVDK